MQQLRDGHVDESVGMPISPLWLIDSNPTHCRLSSPEFRLEDVPDMGYTVQDKPYPRGALLVKTHHMIDSYFGDPDLQ